MSGPRGSRKSPSAKSERALRSSRGQKKMYKGYLDMHAVRRLCEHFRARRLVCVAERQGRASGRGTEHLCAGRVVVRQTTHGTTCHNLKANSARRAGKMEKRRTVEAIAAGTLAMIDMTGLRFRSMKICTHGARLVEREDSSGIDARSQASWTGTCVGR
jgi:hypothetical protein